MQTQFVKVPYENTLGGFALFTQGLTALAPELLGFEGLQYIDPAKGGDIVVYGKHFNIYETEVVVGGLTLPREGTGTTFGTDAKGNPVSLFNNLSPLHTPDGNLVLLKSDGTVLANVKDMGSYNVQSREIMRVRIPSGIPLQTATRGDGTQVVELYVSTPNGISNRLQIPVGTPCPSGRIVVSQPAGPGYALVDQTMIITMKGSLDKDKKLVVGDPIPYSGQPVQLSPLTTQRPTKVAVEFVIPIIPGSLEKHVVISDVEPDEAGVITLKVEHLNKLQSDLLSASWVTTRLPPIPNSRPAASR